MRGGGEAAAWRGFEEETAHTYIYGRTQARLEHRRKAVEVAEAFEEVVRGAVGIGGNAELRGDGRLGPGRSVQEDLLPGRKALGGEHGPPGRPPRVAEGVGLREVLPPVDPYFLLLSCSCGLCMMLKEQQRSQQSHLAPSLSAATAAHDIGYLLRCDVVMQSAHQLSTRWRVATTQLSLSASLSLCPSLCLSVSLSLSIYLITSLSISPPPSLCLQTMALHCDENH